MKGVHLKRKFKYTETAGVVASWLLRHDRYMRQHYRERYNRAVQVQLLIIENFSPRNILAWLYDSSYTSAYDCVVIMAFYI